MYDFQPHDRMSLLEAIIAGCLYIPKTDRDGSDTQKDPFSCGLQEVTEGVMRMRICGHM